MQNNLNTHLLKKQHIIPQAWSTQDYMEYKEQDHIRRHMEEEEEMEEEEGGWSTNKPLRLHIWLCSGCLGFLGWLFGGLCSTANMAECSARTPIVS